MISEPITFRITKAKAKVKFGVKYLCRHDCERSSVQLISKAKTKAKKYLRGIHVTLISVSTVLVGPSSTFGTRSATAKRGVLFCKNPLLKAPPFLGS